MEKKGDIYQNKKLVYINQDLLNKLEWEIFNVLDKYCLSIDSD